MRFEEFLLRNYCILFLCVVLELSKSNEMNDNNETFNELHSNEITYSRETVVNGSREELRPIPLILHMNVSESDILMQEASKVFVSNTSFDDIIGDNETYQLFLKYRERKRQARLMTIQNEVLLKLGFDQEPNITSSISDEQRINLLSSYKTWSELKETNETEAR